MASPPFIAPALCIRQANLFICLWAMERSGRARESREFESSYLLNFSG